MLAAGRYVIRCPVDAYHRHRFAGEAALLAALRRLKLPAAVPRLIHHRAEPAVMVYRKIDGIVSPQQFAPPTEPPPLSLVEDCARFLAALHAAPRRRAIAALPRVDAAMLDYLGGLRHDAPGWLRDFADPALAMLREASAGDRVVLLHNDFNWRNLVVSACGTRLAGVIDWTIAGLGNRHLDLRAIGCLGVEAFKAFAAAYAAAGGTPLDAARADAAARVGLFGRYLHAAPAERSAVSGLIERYRPLV